MEAAAKTTKTRLPLAALRSGGIPKICSTQGAVPAPRRSARLKLSPCFGRIAPDRYSGGVGAHCCLLQGSEREVSNCTSK
uniref:Uncharacterized protein n=1 Tax=Arundo donax TaxID=35708 RepID=A0A0A9C282_ARUDO